MIEFLQFLVILGAVIIFSITNHYDKFLITKYARDFSIGMLLIFSGFIGIPTAFLIWLYFGSTLFVLSGFVTLMIILSGFFYILSLVPYMYAIESEDVSTVTPIFLVMPIITYILSYYVLDEVLTTSQVISMFIIISCIFLLSLYKVDEKSKSVKISLKYKTLGLVLLSSFLNSSLIVYFKYVAIEESYFLTMFWNQIGYVLGGLSLLFVPSYRRGFFLLFKRNKHLNVVFFNILGEVINIIGDFTYRYALLIAPVALVQTLALGFQPIIVFILGIFFTMFMPWFSKENVTRSNLINKGILILIMCGAVLMV